jgi:hypothetical protein
LGGAANVAVHDWLVDTPLLPMIGENNTAAT